MHFYFKLQSDKNNLHDDMMKEQSEKQARTK